ncbi:hypothetical protein [Flavivirga eckloniae]|uniref:Fibronectin type-III domain-containing protein n=1 Tax=Flavivirga eckloniae TaxID=1803846 RepID=A0A2K9PRJ3_9FLAO|nr:hypothetical protein [Flavivirga eckloniae]AUP79693.1 hypothetical protein C1H87_13640 [Flavivirga eckloniae]
MRSKILLIITLVFVCACDDIIEVVDISNETVTVLAPVNETTLVDTDVVFTWGTVEEAEAYKIQIATPSFEAATEIVTDSTVTKTSFSNTLASGSYEWRVRAENSGYATGYTTQKFRLLSPDPVDISKELVVISSPANGATFSTTSTVNFSWRAIEGAEDYVIQIVTPDFENITETITDETITNTGFSISNLSKNDYKCRVKAKNSEYETGYTEIGFTVDEK